MADSSKREEVAQLPLNVSQRTAQSAAQSAAQSTAQGHENLIEKVASADWAEATFVRQAVLAACSQAPRTAQEVADLLNRRVRTVQQNYLRPLVKEGRLEREDGRYRSTDSSY